MADYKYDLGIDGTGYGQPTAESCWWASYAIMYKWKNLPVGSIRERIVKAGLNFDDYYANGLPTDDFWKTRSALGLQGWGGGYAFSIADDFQSLDHLLRGWGALWCAFSRPSAHVVVVIGIDSTMNTIHILNPWSSTGLEADSQYLTPANFRHRLNATSYSVFQAFMSS